MRLVLHKNGIFVLNKPIPNVNICNNGMYDFEPELEENALAFHCDNVINVQGIKRNYSNFELELRFGDPDENRYYYLEKIDN